MIFLSRACFVQFRVAAISVLDMLAATGETLLQLRKGSSRVSQGWKEDVKKQIIPETVFL